MGYDMHWLRRPEGEREQVDATQKVFYAACTARDLLPREERGVFTEEEWEERRAGRASFDDLPANATERYRAAQAEVTRTLRVVDKTHRSYFRLNIGGMGKVREAMIRLDAAYGDYDDSDMPAWPTNVPDDYYEVDDAEQRWPHIAAQYAACRLWSPRENGEGGIPLHKVGSNDGWIVTPEECFVASSTIRATDTDVVLKTLVDCGINNEGWLETWNDWVQWINDASEHGGFEVN